MTTKKQLNLTIRKDVALQTRLEQEIKEGLMNLDKDSINQHENTDRKFKHDDQHYRDLVFNGKISDVEKIKIKLELTHSRDHKTWDIWNYFRFKISSMKITKSVGIQLYFLIKDDTSGKYLGIMSLGSDFGNLVPRDEYIGWDSDTRLKNLKYVLNIRTCIPLQPFGFNYAGGKLIAMLAYSREISEMFIERMKTRKQDPLEYPLLGIITTSLYGKGVQYKDLDEMKYIGLTKGLSTLHVPDKIYDKCKELCKLKNIKMRDNMHARGKSSVIQTLLPSLGLSRDVLNQNHQRGVYYGHLYSNSQQLLVDKDLTDKIALESVDTKQLKTAQEIFALWLEKHGRKRNAGLVSKKMIIKKVNVYSSVEELSRVSENEKRKEKIIEKGTENLPEGMKPTEYNIRQVGLEIVRADERKRKQSSKSAYTKKTFTDKYDIDKLNSIEFDQRNIHLKKYIPLIIEIVNENNHSTVGEIATKLATSYDSIRSILDRVKI